MEQDNFSILSFALKTLSQCHPLNPQVAEDTLPQPAPKVLQKPRKHKMCEHNKQFALCAKCDGSSLCKEHGIQKNQCVRCGTGKGICPHKKIRWHCAECKGASVCEHGIQRTKCKECHGSSICKHNRIKYDCVDCGGSAICAHKKRKYDCKICCKSSQTEKHTAAILSGSSPFFALVRAACGSCVTPE